jgi:hypothetical protein
MQTGDDCEMKEELASKLRDLVFARSTAALGTLHSGAPYVSMVPFAMIADGTAFVIHVSRLAAHTGDMHADPHVSLLISAVEQPGYSPQALPRVTVQGKAQPLLTSSTEYSLARETYLTRFPDAAPLFNLGDFSLFWITPIEIRWVAGFAQARTLTPVAFARAVSGHQD